MSDQSLLLRTLRGETLARPPVWLMRQAGRYLPEYRALREKAGSFWTLCRTPEYAATVALQPIQRYSLDAAIVFSDILTIPEALGCEIAFVEREGPVFKHPLSLYRCCDYHLTPIMFRHQILLKLLPSFS